MNDIRLLLAAEDADSLSFLRRLLKASDCEVVAECGLGAEAVVATREWKPDAVILGMEQPVARSLRTIESLKLAAADYPVVVVSSLKEREWLRSAMLAGARDYLVRPVSPSDFHTALSNMLDIEQRRHHTSEALAEGRQGEIITVFGAKGGIGRSTLALNLAAALAHETNHRVALVDLDIALGDQALLLNVPPERSIAELAPLIDRLDTDLARDFLTVHESRVSVLPAPARPEDGENVRADQVAKILQVLVNTYEYVVVDTPRAFNETTLTALDMARLVLLVAAPDIACLKSTKVSLGMMRLWQYQQDKLKLVINHPVPGRSVKGREIEEALEYPTFWKVPHSSAVKDATQRGRPVVVNAPKSPYARNLLQLAKVVAGTYRPDRNLLTRLFAKV